MNNGIPNDSVLQLASSHSLQVLLESIRIGKAGLDNRRTTLLARVPNAGDWEVFSVNSITTKDIAFLSAKTNDEFAILRSKQSDILFHGIHTHCTFQEELVDMLLKGKLRLVAHSHPDIEQIIPSDDDRLFLNKINQPNSIIISWITGKEIVYTKSKFEI